ncbi:hypothetical protein TKWG_20905 [Advenella kashmirensis WT001]|uniref:Uncharacterized protein n=1 Tax=Advenella kashmirensis (strain DSM 17095 / LMG 22695 / WT001) TaxID=1036672 RepID=I3UFW0_ADVKW|nr:hypothetical protein TKWG_20905 [Advenella kashmirensis WT001]
MRNTTITNLITAWSQQMMPTTIIGIIILKKHHDLKEHESVFGIKFYSGERFKSIKILLFDSSGFESVAEAIRNASRLIQVRIAKIEDMTADDFLKFVNRFSLVMSRQPVIGKEASFED